MIRHSAMEFDGSCVTVYIGVHPLSVLSVSYSDTGGTMTLRSTVARRLLSGTVDTVATITYDHPNIGSDSDMLRGFKIVGVTQEIARGVSTTETKFFSERMELSWRIDAVGLRARRRLSRALPKRHAGTITKAIQYVAAWIRPMRATHSQALQTVIRFECDPVYWTNQRIRRVAKIANVTTSAEP